MLRIVAALAIAISIAGCSANWSSVYRDYRVDDSDGMTSVLIDAKQRAILAKRRSEDPAAQTDAKKNNGASSTQGQGDKSDPRALPKGQEVVCAEPSPDAFSAVGQSLAASGGINPQSEQVQLALSLALAESAGELRRARTIQLLRDGLFVACEGYMNGALTAAEYSKLLNKYADATVTLLAIEQITPQGVSPPITLNSPSTGASISNQTGQSPSGQTPSTPNPGSGNPTSSDQGAGKPDDGNPSSTTPGTGNPSTGDASTKKSGAGSTTQKSGAQQQNGQPSGNSLQPSAQTGSGATTPSSVSALPAATDSAVLAVQYLVKSFLTDTLLNECIAAYADATKDSQLSRNLETFCSTVFEAALEVPNTSQTGSPQPGNQQTTAAQSSGKQGGLSSATILTAQKALLAAGFDPGPLDGKLGPTTTAAIKNYQAKNQLKETGILDAETLAALKVPVSGPSTKQPTTAQPSRALPETLLRTNRFLPKPFCPADLCQ